MFYSKVWKAKLDEINDATPPKPGARSHPTAESETTLKAFNNIDCGLTSAVLNLPKCCWMFWPAWIHQWCSLWAAAPRSSFAVSCRHRLCVHVWATVWAVEVVPPLIAAGCDLSLVGSCQRPIGPTPHPRPPAAPGMAFQHRIAKRTTLAGYWNRTEAQLPSGSSNVSRWLDHFSHFHPFVQPTVPTDSEASILSCERLAGV